MSVCYSLSVCTLFACNLLITIITLSRNLLFMCTVHVLFPKFPRRWSRTIFIVYFAVGCSVGCFFIFRFQEEKAEVCLCLCVRKPRDIASSKINNEAAKFMCNCGVVYFSAWMCRSVFVCAGNSHRMYRIPSLRAHRPFSISLID